MGLNDSLYYLTLGNPLSQSVISVGSGLAKKTGLISPPAQQSLVTKSKPPVPVMQQSLWKIVGGHHNWIRLAGLSGAAAVILGAYGAHRNYDEEKNQSRAIFETANRFHFFHSIVLMAVPITHYPLMTGTLMVAGTLLFTGPCYYRAFTGDTAYSKIAPMGGFCLILAWLSMVL